MIDDEEEYDQNGNLIRFQIDKYGNRLDDDEEESDFKDDPELDDPGLIDVGLDDLDDYE
jgi:hypothetical protein